MGELHRGGSVTNEATLLVFVINDYLFKPGNTGKVVVLLLQKVISFVSLIKEPLGLTYRRGPPRGQSGGTGDLHDQGRY